MTGKKVTRMFIFIRQFAARKFYTLVLLAFLLLPPFCAQNALAQGTNIPGPTPPAAATAAELVTFIQSAGGLELDAMPQGGGNWYVDGGNGNTFLLNLTADGSITLTDHATLLFENNSNTAINLGGNVSLLLSADDTSEYIFQNNLGRAIEITGSNNTLEVHNATFDSNDDGAIDAGLGSTVISIFDSTFVGNSAVSGGAIFNWGTLNLTDVSFKNNHVQTGYGGAIYNFATDSVINITVTDGNTSEFIGNTRTFGGSTQSDSIYFQGGHLNVNTQGNGILDMQDQMNVFAGDVTIYKSGTGTWKLGGNNDLSSAYDMSFTVSQGTLSLYNNATITLGATALKDHIFSLGNGAMLNAGVNNGIIAYRIDFYAGSILGFDMTNAIASTTTNLTLNAGIFGGPKIGSGIISVDLKGRGTPAASGDQFILVDTGMNNTTAANGTLYVDGSWYQNRSAGTMYVLETADTDSKLLLSVIAAANSSNLYWTGGTDQQWDTTTENWDGTVTTAGGGTIGVNTFLEDDSVVFANNYRSAQTGVLTAVSTKIVDLTQDVSVGTMSVTGTDYEFNLDTHKITAAGNLTVTGTGTTFNFGVGSEMESTGGNINFGSGTTVNFAGDNMVTANAAVIIISNGSTIYSGLDGSGNGTDIAADTITIGRDVVFGFDLFGADVSTGTPTTNLTLNATAALNVTEKIGSGRIDIDNVPGGESVSDYYILADTGTVSDKIANTGDVFVDGSAYTPERGGASGIMYGLAVENSGSQLVLKFVDSTQNTTLTWTGTSNGKWSDSQNAAYANWQGDVDGINVKTFLDYDEVLFDNTAVSKIVTLDDNVTVDGMTVSDSGYIFSLSGHTITGANGAVNNVLDFGDGTTIVSSIDSKIENLDAGGSIVFGSNTVFVFDMTGAVDNQGIPPTTNLTLDSPAINAAEKIGSGVIDIENITPLNDTGSYVLADTGQINTTANTGTLYAGGILHAPIRSSAPNAWMYRLETANTDSELHLVYGDANHNTDVKWTGINGSVWDVERAENWTGTSYGFETKIFLNGDKVLFDNTATGSRYVEIAAGGIRVGDMSVTGDGYLFDLRKGGISANTVIEGNLFTPTGTVDLGNAAILIEVSGMDQVKNTITAETIILGGGTLMANDGGVDVEWLKNQESADYEVMTATNPIVGNFANISVTPNPFYRGVFRIEDNVGYLTLSYFRFGGWNHNTREAAALLDVLRNDPAHYALFSSVVSGDPLAAVDSFRGTELAADALGLSLWGPWEITHQRMRTVREESGWNTWGEGYYRLGRVSTDDNAVAFDDQRSGMMIGADYGTSKYWQFGTVLGVGMPEMTNRFGKVKADDFTAGLYSKINVFDAFTANTFLGYGHQEYRMKRHDFSGHYKGNFKGDAMYASVEVVRPVSTPFGLFLPLVALDYQAAWTGAFSETGGIFNQSLDAGNTDRCMLRFGVDGRFHYQSLFDVSTRFQYAFLASGAEQNSIVSRVEGTSLAMNLLGVEMGKGQFNAGIGLSGEYRSRYRWFVDIDGYAANHLTAVQGQLGLSTRW